MPYLLVSLFTYYVYSSCLPFLFTGSKKALICNGFLGVKVGVLSIKGRSVVHAFTPKGMNVY